jgi:hypothetical protein
MIGPPASAVRSASAHQFAHQRSRRAYHAAGGSKRRRRDAWELRVYAGLHPLIGARQYVTKTVRGSEREADRALRRLVDEVDEGSQLPAPGGALFGMRPTSGWPLPGRT